MSQYSFRLNKLIECLYVIYAFYGLSPFFTWDTYHNGFLGTYHGTSIRTLIGVVIVMACLVRKISHFKLSLKKDILLLVTLMMISAFVVLGLSGELLKNIFSPLWIQYLVICFYLLEDDKSKIDIYKMYCVLFAVTLIPSIIYYVFHHFLGFEFKYTILQPFEEIKKNHHFYYKHYFGASQLASFLDSNKEMRLSGLYNEAGVVGTMSALFLAAEKYDLKKNRFNIVVLIAGILSFSLAFYLMTIAYFVVKWTFTKKFSGVFAVLGIVILYLIFINIDFANPILNKLQGRMTITDSGLNGDNRTSLEYDLLFKQFNHSNIYHKLFGYGFGTIGTIQAQRMIDGSSYKSLIYDYGYIGFALGIIWLIVFAVFMYKHKKSDIVFFGTQLIIYLLNIYQRPTMFAFSYLLVFMGGMFSTISEIKVSDNNTLCRFMQKEGRTF